MAVAQMETGSAQVLRAKVEPLLTTQERILGIAGQTPIARWWVFPPDGVVVTTHRILLVRLGIFTMSFQDFHWEHVEDVHLALSFIGAAVRVTASASKSGIATHTMQAQRQVAAVTGLEKADAQRLYARAQEMEETWRERTRGRVMEETLAHKAHHVLAAPLPAFVTAPAGAGSGGGGVREKLAELKALADEGLITGEELAEKRRALLAGM